MTSPVKIEIGSRGGSSFVAVTGPKFSAAVRRGSVAGMERGLRRIVKVIRDEKLNGQMLKSRSGDLRRAVFHHVLEHRLDAFGVIGVDLKMAPHGRVHELGGVIRPKRAQHLTVPLDAVLDGRGLAMFSARQVIRAPQAYGYAGTFVHNKVIFGKDASGGIVPLFALRDQVVLKPVGYIGKTMKEQRPALRADIRDGVNAELKKEGLTRARR